MPVCRRWKAVGREKLMRLLNPAARRPTGEAPQSQTLAPVQQLPSEPSADATGDETGVGEQPLKLPDGAIELGAPGKAARYAQHPRFADLVAVRRAAARPEFFGPPAVEQCGCRCAISGRVRRGGARRLRFCRRSVPAVSGTLSRRSQVPHATVWLGEALIQRGAYEPAAEVLLTGFQAYPGSPREPDILLQLGVALTGAGETDTACRKSARSSGVLPGSCRPFCSGWPRKSKGPMRAVGGGHFTHQERAALLAPLLAHRKVALAVSGGPDSFGLLDWWPTGSRTDIPRMFAFTAWIIVCGPKRRRKRTR